MAEGPQRILILDRDGRAAARILSGGGYWVTTTDDLREAARIARESGADILLVDMSMKVMEVVPRWERRKSDPQPAKGTPPVAEGYAVLRSIEADPAATRYPAVFLSDGHRETDRTGAMRFGVVGYIQKPVTAQRLLPRMQAVLRSLRFAARSAESGQSLGGDPRLTSPSPAPSLDLSLSLDGDPLGGWSVPSPPFESLPRALRKALLMDADAGYRGYLRDLMESQGFTVFEAAHTEAALRLALEKRPWLILTDVNMPGAEGFELCRSVRGHSLISHTPLIFLSSWDGYRERYHALKLGADDYVSKAASSRELLIRVQLILKRYSDLGTRTRRGAGMEGQIELVGAPGALQMCHLGQLTGVFTVRRGSRLLEIAFRAGEIISAESGRTRGVDAVYDFLSWDSGHFEFIPRDPGEGEALGTFEKLLLEGCRLMDEALRDEEPQPSAGRSPVVPFRSPLS